MASSNKVREQLTQKFLAALDQGRIPWEACWSQGRPENATTGKTYRGVNAITLSYAADDRGYTDPRWCTYNQAQQNGWQVRKGETSAAAVEYWAYYDLKEKKLLSWQQMHDKLKADPDYEKHLQLRCRIYPVFNAQQIDGIPELEERRQTDIGILRQQRDTLIRNMGICYEEYGNRAFYSPSIDRVVLPPEASFDDTYSYMATFLHECGHATGHPDRLNRDLSGFKGSESYAREELRAEIASAFTAQSLGLQLTPSQLEHHTQLHAAYVQSWAGILKDAPDELFRAIKTAEEISDYLIEKGEFNMEQTQQKSELKEWYIVEGNTDQLVIVPAEELRGRQVVETFRCTGLLDAMDKLHRYEELQSCFWSETNEPETHEWREELTAEETAMVQQWDTQTASGFSKLASDIREQSAPAEQITVAIESTDDYTDANFHAELRDMEKQNSDGSYGTPVDYYPETMTVVMVEPNQQARIIELPHTLEAMQQTVGGSIEATYPFEDPVAVICNKEDKLNSLPLNRALYGEGGDVYDVLCGTFFVTGVGTEDFCSLSPDLAQKYLEQFKSPEQFFRINGHIVALKTEQENIGQVLDDYLASQSVSEGPTPAPVAEAPTLNMGG